MTAGEFLDWHPDPANVSLVDVFEAAVAAHPDRLFCSDGLLRLTYGEAARAIDALAADIAKRVAGRDVALVTANRLSFYIAYLGVLRAGGAAALINAAIPATSITAMVEALDAALVIAPEPGISDNAYVLDGAAVAQLAARHAKPPAHRPAPDDVATYLYTGGTTGVPKRIAYTNRQIMAAGARMQWGWPIHDGEVFLHIAPFSHVYGFLMGVCCTLQGAGSAILPERFHPDLVLDLMARERVSVLGGGPPPVYQALVAHPGLAERDLSALRVCPGGGAPFPRALMDRWRAATGLELYEGYGMTEMAPVVVNTAHNGARAGTSGRVVPDTEVKIVDVETGTRILGPGEAGEICARGPHMMAGYVGNPEETALVLRDGWIHTGDIGVMDEDGFLAITDRKKDMIITKGFNVFPREVEEVLATHPAVATVCVVGAPDARSGEAVVAFIGLRPGAEATPETLRAHCAEAMSDYKLPAIIHLRAALPQTPAGKLDRMAMRAEARGAG